MPFEIRQMRDQFVSKLTRVLVNQGLDAKEIPVFVTDKGAIASPDIFFKRGNEFFAVEVKGVTQPKLEKDLSWEDVAQTQSIVGIIREATNLPMRARIPCLVVTSDVSISCDKALHEKEDLELTKGIKVVFMNKSLKDWLTRGDATKYLRARIC